MDNFIGSHNGGLVGVMLDTYDDYPSFIQWSAENPILKPRWSLCQLNLRQKYLIFVQSKKLLWAAL